MAEEEPLDFAEAELTEMDGAVAVASAAPLDEAEGLYSEFEDEEPISAEQEGVLALKQERDALRSENERLRDELAQLRDAVSPIAGRKGKEKDEKEKRIRGRSLVHVAAPLPSPLARPRCVSDPAPSPLCCQHERLESQNLALKKNISCLFKTARKEIERKDALLASATGAAPTMGASALPAQGEQGRDAHQPPAKRSKDQQQRSAQHHHHTQQQQQQQQQHYTHHQHHAQQHTQQHTHAAQPREPLGAAQGRTGGPPPPEYRRR